MSDGGFQALCDAAKLVYNGMNMVVGDVGSQRERGVELGKALAAARPEAVAELAVAAKALIQYADTAGRREEFEPWLEIQSLRAALARLEAKEVKP